MRKCFGKVFDGGGILTAVMLALVVVVQPVRAQVRPIGVGVHPSGLSMPAQAAQIKLVGEAGLDSVRFDMPWKYVEKQRGQYAIPGDLEHYVDLVNKRGIQPVLILDYGNPLYDGGDKPRSRDAIQAFTAYATFVVDHFRGRVRQFEVWNEWDNYTGGFHPGSPEDYAVLFRAVYPAVKAVNPDAMVLVGAGVHTGWEERLAELGVVQMGDGLAVHPYNFQLTDDLAPEHCIQKLAELEARLQSITKRANIDLYVTEIGWPTNAGRYGVSEDVARSFAVRLVLLARSLPYLKGVWWYDLVDDGHDPQNKEHHFGLFRTDLSPKPAATGISAAVAFATTRKLKLATPGELSEGAIAIEARPLGGGPREMVAWDVRQSGRLRIDCTAVGDVRTIKQDFGAAALPAVPAGVVARAGRCDFRVVDPT
jgi:hypothetical protein